MPVKAERDSSPQMYKGKCKEKQRLILSQKHVKNFPCKTLNSLESSLVKPPLNFWDSVSLKLYFPLQDVLLLGDLDL